ncbi:DUF6542 domain-containing protein [Marinactinospora rubrisoli]|uniref:DUF6542 domain-containing protein n=1 Tax=Marinactinospora rubrisoli TaxID=2715399 RepID=A0ABW2KCM0_9ACTN
MRRLKEHTVIATHDADGTPVPRDTAHSPRGRRRPQRGRSARPATVSRLRLTARGAILALVLATFGAALLERLAGVPSATSITFVVVCVLAAFLVRPGDLLALAVSPPLGYFTGVLAAEAVLTLGSDGFVRAVLIGLATRLADIAPSLFLGTGIVLAITAFRGLPANIRELGDELSGRPARRGRDSGRRGRTDSAAS